MRHPLPLLSLLSLLMLCAPASASATKYYYVGGPQPGLFSDGSWQWRETGIQAAYDWIKANGTGTDWDIRVHSSYQENVGPGNIDITYSTVPVNRIQGSMTWTTGQTGPLNVAQNLAQKTLVTGSSDRVFLLHGLSSTQLTTVILDGFQVNGAVRISSNSAGSAVMNCRVSGLGTAQGETREGIHIHDTNNGVYVLNSLVEGFVIGLKYMDNVNTRCVFVVHSTIAGSTTGVSNDTPPSWVGKLQFFNTIIVADHIPVDQTVNPASRYYNYTDVYDGDGSFNFDGVSDINNNNTSIRENPLLQPDFTLGDASPCIGQGKKSHDGAGFCWVDLNSNDYFDADYVLNPDGTIKVCPDVVLAGTPPSGARYIILKDLAGNARLSGAGVDLGALEWLGGAAPVPEPGPSATLLLAVLGLVGRARRA